MAVFVIQHFTNRGDFFVTVMRGLYSYRQQSQEFMICIKQFSLVIHFEVANLVDLDCSSRVQKPTDTS
jgi:hypothetical protein